jgi:hypothetical protein
MPPKKPKPEEPNLVKDILDLKEALEDSDIPPEAQKKLELALANLIKIPADLTEIPDKELMETDATAQARRLYIGSLLRLWTFMAQRPMSQDIEEKQARLALGYVKHIEGSKSLSLNLGKTVADDKLVEEVNTLRNEMASLVKKRKGIAKVVEMREKDGVFKEGEDA